MITITKQFYHINIKNKNNTINLRKKLFIPKICIFNHSIYNFSQSKSYKQVVNQIIEPIQTKFRIVDKQKLNHDCYKYKFYFIGPKFSLRPGQHFKLIFNIPTQDFPKGEQIIRMYTPLSSCQDFDNNKIQLLLKIYRPNNQYPKGGIITPHFQNLQIGQQIDVQGPLGRFLYQSPGRISIAKSSFSKTKKLYEIKRIFFIAGGTGITPMYQTINQIVKNKKDNTELTLLFCNKTQNDILLKKQLQMLKPRVNVNFMVEQPTKQWNGLTGRINKEVINQIHSLNDPHTFYLYCGPKGMNLALTKMFQQHYKQMKYFKI